MKKKVFELVIKHGDKVLLKSENISPEVIIGSVALLDDGMSVEISCHTYSVNSSKPM